MKNWKELYREINVDNEIDNGINEKKKWKRYLSVFLVFFDILDSFIFVRLIRVCINNIKRLIRSNIDSI